MWISAKKYMKLVEDNTNLEKAYGEIVEESDKYRELWRVACRAYTESLNKVQSLEHDNKVMSSLLIGDAE